MFRVEQAKNSIDLRASKRAAKPPTAKKSRAQVITDDSELSYDSDSENESDSEDCRVVVPTPSVQPPPKKAKAPQQQSLTKDEMLRECDCT